MPIHEPGAFVGCYAAEDEIYAAGFEDRTKFSRISRLEMFLLVAVGVGDPLE